MRPIHLNKTMAGATRNSLSKLDRYVFHFQFSIFSQQFNSMGQWPVKGPAVWCSSIFHWLVRENSKSICGCIYFKHPTLTKCFGFHTIPMCSKMKRVTLNGYWITLDVFVCFVWKGKSLSIHSIQFKSNQCFAWAVRKPIHTCYLNIWTLNALKWCVVFWVY